MACAILRGRAGVAEACLLGLSRAGCLETGAVFGIEQPRPNEVAVLCPAFLKTVVSGALAIVAYIGAVRRGCAPCRPIGSSSPERPLARDFLNVVAGERTRSLSEPPP